MLERQLCIDIPVDDSESLRFNKVKDKVEKRKPKVGKLYLKHQERWSCLRGGERTVLNEIVENKISGELVSVDGISQNAINVSVNVSLQETNRLLNEGYIISAELNIEGLEKLRDDSR